MIGLVLSLLIIVIFVALIVRRLNRSNTHTSGASPYVLRRFFQYLVLFGLLIIVAVGVSGLIQPLFENDTMIQSRSELARSLAFTVVGMPILAGLAWWTRKRFRENRDEGDSHEWGLYITAAAITSLAVAMTGALDTLNWVFGISAFDADAMARLIVWGTVWGIHYWLSTKITSFERNRPHDVFGTVIGVAVAVGGVVTIFGSALDSLLFQNSSLIAQDRGLREGLAALIIGALVWYAYWFRRVLKSHRDVLWLAYVLLLGVAGGLAMWVIAASTALYRTAVWFVGEPIADTAAGHFANLPTLIAAAVVGLLVWWYHRAVLATGPQVGRTEVSRIYEYLIAGIGLLAATAGLATVIIAIFDALVGSPAFAGGSAINTLLAAVTLLIVGLPFWWIFWKRAQSAAAATPAVEVPSVSRRTYLFLLFGVGGITAIVSLLVAMYAFFDDMVQGTLSQQTVRDMRIAVSILIATGLVAAYHVIVYNRDRTLNLGDLVAHRPRYVLLVGERDEGVSREIAHRTGAQVAHRTGAQVQSWQRADGGGFVFNADAVVDALSGVAAEEVLVVGRSGVIEVVPIRRR